LVLFSVKLPAPYPSLERSLQNGRRAGILPLVLIAAPKQNLFVLVEVGQGKRSGPPKLRRIIVLVRRPRSAVVVFVQ